jgi:hypothetical protein
MRRGGKERHTTSPTSKLKSYLERASANSSCVNWTPAKGLSSAASQRFSASASSHSRALGTVSAARQLTREPLLAPLALNCAPAKPLLPSPQLLLLRNKAPAATVCAAAMAAIPATIPTLPPTDSGSLRGAL